MTFTHLFQVNAIMFDQAFLETKHYLIVTIEPPSSLTPETIDVAGLN